MMLTVELFRNQNIDKTPYSQEQMEFVIEICNQIKWPWSCFEDSDVSVSTISSVIGESYVLKINDLCYMTTTPADILDHRSIYETATGNILLTGLGLGLGFLMATHNTRVDSITVVESNSVVLKTIAPMLPVSNVSDVRFIEHDADTWNPDMHFDFAYIDHAYSRANSERYCEHSDIVVNWYDERVKLEATWR
jgi:hypothetical protein